MFLNISDSEKGNNKGSSAELAHYLDKEQRLFPEDSEELWFNHAGRGYASYEVKNKIDGNIAKLCKTDDKFFLVNISPSQKEIAHLKSLYGAEGAKEHLKKYAVKVMDEYARTFKRKGVDSCADLVWFAKLENHRYYSYKDKEVKQGLVKAGTPKQGEQTHIQVIVSRKDISNTIRLSPKNTSRGKNRQHSKLMGEFNRVAFKAAGEALFDQMFEFERSLKETFAYANNEVNGTLAERLAFKGKTSADDMTTNQISSAQHLQGLENNKFTAADTGTLLDHLLAKPDFDPAPANSFKKKRRKRKGGQQDQHFSR